MFGNRGSSQTDIPGRAPDAGQTDAQTRHTAYTSGRITALSSWTEPSVICEWIHNWGQVTSGRESFAEDEVATLCEFADSGALGYARYLDIREIQEHTERKIAFLASMFHELRTPMNAIKGFTDLVLRRDQAMEDRSRENLQNVTKASDHLLGMINDLLDLSKIEAGRMEVTPERFDVKELIESNAIKFTEDGEVVVRANRAPPDTFRSPTRTLGDTVTAREDSADRLLPTVF
ncbi:MAG: hypothetical protein CME26_06520 [Gemmatimonadetes bacterium]|nr:hypothetical protein [Gemmatimonadota bacterium]